MLSDASIYCIGWAAFFCTLQFLFPHLLLAIWPAWWNQLSDKKRSEIPPCLAALVHHVVAVSCGLYIFYWEYVNGYVISASLLLFIAPFVYGYLIGDILFYALPEAIAGKYEYIAHHVLGLWITGAVMSSARPEVLVLVPVFLITESSSIAFIIGWIMRYTSYKTSSMINYLDMIFALLFTVTRIINFPYKIYKAWPYAEELGIARYTMIPIIGLQFFWFYKILLQVTGMKKTKANKE